MADILEIVSLACVGVIAYTYIGYPALLFFAPKRSRNTPHREVSPLPSVAVVISVYNEADLIGKRIDNLLSSDYPSDRLTVFVGSDGSHDGTNDVLQNVRDRRMHQRIYTERRGKAAVLNDLLKLVTSDIVVFSDANTVYDASCIRSLVRAFDDPSIGGVCGELCLRTAQGEGGLSNEGVYWAYESYIKRREGAIESTIGATGAVYAVRRALVRPLPTDRVLADDLMQSLHVIDQGYRFVYEAGALAYESPATRVKGEMQRRMRIGAGNIAALRPYLRLLDPRNGWVAVSLWSHKVLRWSVPFLAAVFLLAVGLARILDGFGTIDVAVAGFATACFLLGWWSDRTKRDAGLCGWLYYGVLINIGLGIGLARGLFGRLQPTWEKVARSDGSASSGASV